MKTSVQVGTTNRLTGRVLAVFMFAVIGSLLYIAWRQTPFIFQLQFNYYALLSAASVVANVLVLALVSRIKGHVEGLQWFVLYVSGATVFGFSEVMQRLSATPSAAIFWTDVSTIGITLVPLSVYFFVASYVGQHKRNTMLLSLFLVCSGLLIFLTAQGNVLVNNNPRAIRSFAWGYNNPTEAGYAVYIAWVGVLSIVALWRLYRFRKSATQQIIRKQSLIFMVAIGFPILVGIVNDGILPAFQYLVLPYSVLAETVTSIMILYALRRYRLFEINPELLSTNILSTMGEAVIVTRPDYSIEMINPKAEQLLQIAVAEARGKALADFFDKDAWRALSGHVRPTSGAKLYSEEVRLQGLHGQLTPVRVAATAMQETDELEVYIFVISDITELSASYHDLEIKNKHISIQNRTLTENRAELARLLEEAHDLQQQLAQEKASVEHTVTVRTKELVAAQEQLKAAERLKTEFMILSSHNLRTPLTVFLGGLELIKTTHLNAKQTEVIDMIASSASNLKQFVDDMLTISLLEAGEQLRQEPVALEKVIEPLIAEALTMAKTKGLSFAFEMQAGDAIVECSLLRLQGAFRNLLNNAFKFTPKGQIKLQVSIKGKNVVLSVSDTGIGIKQSELPKLFSKFHRATDTMQYDYEGEGIGLYLTKLIITDHHGKITVSSKLKKGTTVTVTLPLHHE